jgi:hypothetical protein
LDLIILALVIGSGTLLAVYHEDQGRRVLSTGVLFLTYAICLLAYVLL